MDTRRVAPVHWALPTLSVLARPCLIHRASSPRSIVQSAAILNLIHRAFTSRYPALCILTLRAQTTMATHSLYTPAFTRSSSSPKYGPRTGRIHIDREDGTTVIHADTPALLTATSRGLVPHLSRDNVHLTQAIRLLQLPFESLYEFSSHDRYAIQPSSPSSSISTAWIGILQCPPSSVGRIHCTPFSDSTRRTTS